MTAEVQQLRMLLAAATPGPWETDADEPMVAMVNHAEVYAPDEIYGSRGIFDSNFGTTCADARLIVAAVNALPALLDQLEAVTYDLAQWEASAASGELAAEEARLEAENDQLRADLEASRAREARYREALKKIASDDAEGGGCQYCTAPMDDVGKHDSWCPVQIARAALDEAGR